MLTSTNARRRVPTIMQQDAVECGAACLAMILAYHGRWMSLEALRELCGVSRDGTKAGNIVRAARTLGLTAKGLRRETAELHALKLPAILFWQFNHFIVLEGFTGGGAPLAWVNDPATGPRRVESDEFDRCFTGVVLAFEPAEGFVRRGARPSLAGLLARLLHPFRRPLAAAAAAATLLLVPGFLAACLAQFLTDQVVSAGHGEWLIWGVAGLGALALLRALLLWVQLATLARTQSALLIAQASRHMRAVLALPVGFFAQRHAGDIASRFWMIDRLAALLAHGLAPAVASLLGLIVYGSALFLLDPVLAAITAGSTLGAVTLLALSARGLEDMNRRTVADEARLQAMTVQGLSMLEEYRASGTEAMFLRRHAGTRARLIETTQEAGRRAALLSAGASLLIALGAVAVLSIGAVRVLDAKLALGGLLAFQLLQHGFATPVLGLVGLGAELQQVRGLAERLDDLHPPDPVPPPLVPDGAAKPGLELRALRFAYAPLAPDVIEGISLHVPAGTRLALVGGSGSGKSTLGRLIVGLLPPREGAVLLDATPITDLPDAALRRRVAYVDQHIALFDGPVRDNLTLWDPTLPESRMIAAARDAQIHEPIAARPGAYASLLSEGGGNLSGGERQRLALARALALDPDLLVLDEATSALDPPAEQAVSAAIRRRGCTCVIIAHRLSTIRDCEQIVVLEAGKIIESGTHAALLARNGAYARLVEH